MLDRKSKENLKVGSGKMQPPQAHPANAKTARRYVRAREPVACPMRLEARRSVAHNGALGGNAKSLKTKDRVLANATNLLQQNASGMVTFQNSDLRARWRR
jgi:hypothetical protein